VRVHRAVPARFRGSPVVAIGMFDGVHRGHAAILGDAVARARASGRRSVVFTFDRHPLASLAPHIAPHCLMTGAQRLAALAACGVDEAVVVRFTRAFSLITPADFVRRILVQRMGASHVTVGYDFRFGRGGKGDAELLSVMGARLGFGVTVVPPVLEKGEPISSTRIRRLVSMGRVRGAARLLGRPFAVAGRTVRGRGLGRKLGFPTINVRPANELIPPPGVYRARFGPRGLPAVANLGFRPTVERRARPPLLEVHLLGRVPRQVPGRPETLLLDFVRPERRFRSFDALRARIAVDVAAARAAFGRSATLTGKRRGR